MTTARATVAAGGGAATALRWADAMLLLVAVVWGTSYGVAKQALAFYPVLGFLAVRFCLTFVLLAPAWLRLAPALRRRAARQGVPLGINLLAIFLCETFGIALTSASNASFLVSLCVVFTPLAEWLLIGSRPQRRAIAMVAVSLAGAALLTDGLQTHFGLGDALMLTAAGLRATMVCFTRRFARDLAVPALAMTAVQAGVVGCGSLVAAVLLVPGGLPALPAAPSFWACTAWLVLACTVFAFFAQNYGLARSTPTRVSLLMGTEPAFGALFAVAWLGESLSTRAWCGGGLIVAVALWAALPRTARDSG